MEAVCETRSGPAGEFHPRDRGASPPAYLHIANTIAERLASGLYRAGARLPSEAQFREEFGVSHMTVRRALGVLTEKGLISATKGSGTFARSFDLGDSTFSLRQIIEEGADAPLAVRLLSASTIAANNRIAAVFDLPPGESVVYLRQLVLKGDTPAMYHREYVLSDAHRPFVEVLLQSTSLHGLLGAGEGEGFPRGTVALRATALGRAAARILGEPPGAPALCVEHLFRDTADRPLSWGYFLLRADLFKLQSWLGPGRPDDETDPEIPRRYQR
ncbi:MAG: GntR family transcriptional regulator [Thermoleophilia bacterium]|nr:GntR family transcriptional regulator [Thermoleophilia bacterium]